MIISLHNDEFSLDTKWTYKETLDNLESQGIEMIVTGGSYLLTGHIKPGLFGKILSLSRMYNYFYSIDFEKRESGAKMESITKTYSSSWEKKHGLHSSEKIWNTEMEKIV